MKRTEKIKADLTGFLNNIKESSIELIDFDCLSQTFGEMIEILDEHDSVTAELEFLNNEYRTRIIGMLKAILACRKSDEDIELATRLSDDTNLISAYDLSNLYTRVSGRFRTCFPSSFRNLNNFGGNIKRSKNWNEHKL